MGALEAVLAHHEVSLEAKQQARDMGGRMFGGVGGEHFEHLDVYYIYICIYCVFIRLYVYSYRKS